MFVCRYSQVVVNLGLVYKVQHHSGVIFQFVAFIRKRKRMVADIVAAGGRYDHLVGCCSSVSCTDGTLLSACFIPAGTFEEDAEPLIQKPPSA